VGSATAVYRCDLRKLNSEARFSLHKLVPIAPGLSKAASGQGGERKCRAAAHRYLVRRRIFRRL
jgi:hypothetical protein